MLIINDKKTTFKGVNILTYFFTRNAPVVKYTGGQQGINYQKGEVRFVQNAGFTQAFIRDAKSGRSGR